jgi:ABC-type Fe3+ transport system substrate-binding protein
MANENNVQKKMKLKKKRKHIKNKFKVVTWSLSSQGQKLTKPFKILPYSTQNNPIGKNLCNPFE